MMVTEEKEIFEVNGVFYHAFESLDIRNMEKVWANESYIQCIHPGWGRLRGWEPVMESWRRIFENTQEIRFLLTEVRVEVQDSLAWVTLYENITSRLGDEVVTGVVLATNIFEKRPGGWFIIHHHGSSVALSPNQLNPSTVH
ncbi:MAG: nuclear transport factor 2 family protein [Candidatus Binatia bacterium]